MLQQGADIVIDELAIDTRKIARPEQTMFIAIKTRHRDGHSFIANAYERGVRCFLISQDVDAAAYEGASFIKVADTVTALQQLATAHRRRYDIPCIGITGSNGKTIVKEWLHQLLAEDYVTVRSPKSYNSQIGVPMSVWLLGSTPFQIRVHYGEESAPVCEVYFAVRPKF